MQTELILNVKVLYHLYELGSNDMARPVYYNTALYKVCIFIRDYRHIATASLQTNAG